MTGKVGRGLALLYLRLGIVQVITFGVTVVLARRLSPSVFGLYVVLGFFTSFLRLIGDGGLSTGLIQQKNAPSAELLRAFFTALQLFYVPTSILGWLLGTVFLHQYPGIGHLDVILVILVMTYYLETFRVLPVVKLERDLEYGRLAAVETIEALAFQIGSLVLVLHGYRLSAFVWAGLISRIAGLISIYSVAPTRIGLSRRIGLVRPLLKLGLSVQSMTILSFLRDAIIPSFMGLVLGPAAVGYVDFANRTAGYTKVPLYPIDRVAFSTLARLQDHSNYSLVLQEFITNYAVLTVSVTVTLAGFLPSIVKIIFTSKWLPAVNLIYSQLFVMFVGSLVWPMMTALQSKAVVREWMIFALVQFFGTWVIGIPALHFLGLNGWIVVSVLLQIPVIIVFRASRKYFQIRIGKIALVVGVAMVLTLLADIVVRRTVPQVLWTLPLEGIFSVGLFLILCYASNTWNPRRSYQLIVDGRGD